MNFDDDEVGWRIEVEIGPGFWVAKDGRKRETRLCLPKYLEATLAEKNLGTAAGARVSEGVETVRRWKVGVWSEVAGG